VYNEFTVTYDGDAKTVVAGLAGMTPPRCSTPPDPATHLGLNP